MSPAWGVGTAREDVTICLDHYPSLYFVDVSLVFAGSVLLVHGMCVFHDMFHDTVLLVFKKWLQPKIAASENGCKHLTFELAGSAA